MSKDNGSKSAAGQVFWYSRYLVLIAVIGLLVGAVATLLFGGALSVTMVTEAFRHGQFDAEGARQFSSEMIELIDIFLLGTVLLITSVGLYQLFIDPTIKLPGWLSVTNLEQLKVNLVAVIIVMLTVLFLGAAASDFESGFDLLTYGGGIALVILAVSAAAWILQRVHQHEIGHDHAAQHQETTSEDARP